LAVIGLASAASGVRAQNAAPLPPQVNPGAINSENQQLQRQLQEQQQAPSIQGPLITAPPRPGAPASGPSPTFSLKGVTFDKSQFLSDSALADIARPFIGKEVSFADLQHIIDAVDSLYDKKGILTASAVLPPQRIADGVVHIALIEGRLGKMQIEGNEHTSENFIRDRLPLQQGVVVDLPELQNELIYFNKTNDIKLTAAVQPGAEFGLSDVQLSVHEPPQNALSVFVDNEGNVSTSRYEAGLMFQRADTLGIDDRLTLYASAASGIINGNASYTVPIGIDGGRIGVSYSQNHIEIVEGALASKDVTGAFQTIAINFSHPLWVNEQWLLTADGSLSDTQTDNLISEVITSSGLVDKGTAGVTLSGGGADYTLSVVQHVSVAQAWDDVRGTRNWFTVYNGSLVGTKELWFGVTGVLNAAWQYTSAHSLPPNELFLVGGATSVSGYVPGAIAGPAGYYFAGELHHEVPFLWPKLDGFVFFDQGEVHSLTTPHLNVASAGVGFNWNWNSLSLNLIAGAPLERPTAGVDDYVSARLIWHAF
jgi:hemolysin activation/secretion protein